MQQKKVSTVKVVDLAMTFLRRWPVVFLSVLVCSLLALFLGVTAAKTYTATATLTVAPITTSPFSSAAVNQQINITTERAILASGEVAAIAAQELGEKISTGSLQNNTETAAPSGSQILEVSVTLADPQKAANQANALAKAYLQFRSQDAAEVAAGYITQLDERLKVLNSGTALTDAQRQQIQDLQQQRTALTLASSNPGRLIGSATVPSEPSSMGEVIYLSAGVMGGLLLGLVLALVWERSDGKVRSASRQRDFFDSELVVINGEEQEPLRWLVRTVRLSGARRPREYTIFVGVITLPGGGPLGLPRWLAAVAKRHELDVATVGSQSFNGDAVDLGWPVRGGTGRWEDNDIVFVEVGGDITGTRLADLADRMDLLFISAGKQTPLRTLKETLQLVQTVPAQRIIPIFYVPNVGRGHQRRKKNADSKQLQAASAPGPNTSGTSAPSAAPVRGKAGNTMTTSTKNKTAAAAVKVPLNSKEH